jgi:hypothetical protein
VQEFDESQDMAGKPIPGFLCRVATPERKEKSVSLDQQKNIKITKTGRTYSKTQIVLFSWFCNSLFF